VFEQPDTDVVKARTTHVLEALGTKFPKAAADLARRGADGVLESVEGGGAS
jgi:hypothetical protein